MYIFWFLHQTTTLGSLGSAAVCCISFDSYIKPQLAVHPEVASAVVYLLIPTSNHNWKKKHLNNYLLYIFWFLHQTTTARAFFTVRLRLYIFWFLHQTTTSLCAPLGGTLLYIFWFLHQTTTPSKGSTKPRCCISFDSYIKPQLTPGSIKTFKSCISFDSYIKPQPR